MPELPTCVCVRGLSPYDRLTAIYQAAAELSGSPSLPDPLCIAGVPPFQRFAYIYEAFRGLAAEGSLPSQLCVAGESPQDQVSRIYQAAAIYADDAALPSYECVRGMPIWQQWIEIYRALYLAAGSPAGLLNPSCVSIANLDILSEVFCALVADGGGGATLLASFYIPEIVDSFERTIAAGYSGNGDIATFQREAAIDVLRSSHYQSGAQYVLLEDVPTICVLVAPENIVGVGGDLEFDASWNAIPVTVSLLQYEWQLDGVGGWTSNGVSTALAGVSTSSGDHFLSVRAISTSGVEGGIGVSAEFTVTGGSGPTLVKYEDFETGGVGAHPITDIAGWSNKEGATGVSDLFGGHHAYPDNSGDYSCAFWSSGADSLNQRVEFTVEDVSPSIYFGAAVRVQGGSVSFYALYCNTTNISLQERHSGVSSVLTNTPFALSQGDKVAIEVIGSGLLTQISVEVNTGSGWTSLDPGIVPTIPLGVGKAGINGYGQSGIVGISEWSWFDL